MMTTTKMWVMAAVVALIGNIAEAAPKGGGRRVPPGAFSLSSPANGATNQSLTPTLSWTAASRATRYDVTIFPNAPVPVTTNSYAVPVGKLNYSTTYSWTVRAFNAYGFTDPSAPSTFSFTTMAPPAVDTTPPSVSVSHTPSPPNPTQAVTYSASAGDVSGMFKLELYVEGILRSTGTTSCSWSEGPLAAGTTRSYRAVAIDNSPNRNSAEATGGFTVSEVSTSVTTAVLAGVQFVDANFVIAVGSGGTVVRSFNGGATWSAKTQGSDYLYSASFSNALTGNVVGGNTFFASGKNYRTGDGGNSFTSQSGTGNVLLGVSFTDANNGVVVGNGGYVAHTNNGGSSWNLGASGTTYSIYEVDMVSGGSSGMGTAVGFFGYIGHTSNGGASWTAQSSGTTMALYGVSFANAGTGYVVGEGGVILKTADGGGTWTAQTSGTGYTFRSVSCTDANTATAVGDAGIIYRTTNGGSTWTAQASGTQYVLYGVSFRDANNGVAVGYNGLIFQTTNGGSTWVKRN